MSSNSQREPFLSYTDTTTTYHDEEDAAKQEARHYRNVQRTGRNYLPHLILCFATSFFWAGLFFLFLPDAPAHLAAECQSNITTPPPSSPPTIHGPGHDHKAPTTTTTSSSISRINITTGAHLLHCGTTVAEAKSLYCKYDILLNNWVPSPCYSQEFIDEYVDENGYSEANGWGGYADEAMTQKLSLKEMSEVPFYYTDLRDHVVHCAVMWKKQFATMFEYEAKGVLDTVLASGGHTDHCAQYLMDARFSNYTGPTKTQMGFAGCWVRI